MATGSVNTAEEELQSPTTSEPNARESTFLASRYDEVNLLSKEHRGALYHVLETGAPHNNGETLSS